MSKLKGKIRLGVGLVAVLMIVSVVASLFILPTGNASAASDEDTIWRKTWANAIQACYQDKIIDKKVNAQNFGIASAFNNIIFDRGAVVTLDSTVDHEFITCAQAFTKMNAFFGKSPSSPVDLGYTLSENADSEAQEKCLYLEYDMQSNGGMRSGFTTQQICFAVSGDETTSVVPILSGEPTGGIYFNLYDEYNFMLHYDYQFTDASGMTNDFSNDYTIRFSPAKWSEVLSSIQSRVRELNDLPIYNNVKIVENREADNNARQDFVMNDLGAGAKAALKFYTGSDDFDQFKFTNEDIKFVQNRAFNAFEAAGAIVEFESCYPSKEGALEQGYRYARYNEATGQWCPVNVVNEYAKQPQVTTSLTSLGLFDASTLLVFITDRNLGIATKVGVCVQAAQDRWDEMQAAWNAELQKPEDERNQEYTSYLISSLILISDMLKNDGRGTWTEDDNGNISCLPKPTLDGGTDVADPNAVEDNDNLPPINDEEEPTAETAPCLATSGSLGWVLCPALDIISGATQVIYNNIVENWLTITTNEVGDATEKGWGMVRDFANIIFVIALVVVVLSQVTGIGLSNYGIKKMLPTLIMVAVLVNLSFIFCELAVDLSNIIGAGINDLFNEATSIVSVKADFNDIMTGLVGGAGMGIFTTAIAAGGLIWAWANPGVWLPPLLLTLIVCLISVVFFFILLAVRKAGVIVLIVLAPVAIVCYALPNTKKFFDKWKRMFISLLMFYPICGLMMGGSKFVSALLKNSDNDGIMYNLVAMLIQVVPFFFIPTVLRGSLQAMGNIGAKLSGLGQRWSHGLTGRMRNAETFKDWQSGMRFNDTERQKKMAGRLKNNRFLGKAATWASNTRAGKAIGAANQRANARAITAYQKRLQEAEQANYIANNTTAESIQAGLDAMRLKQQQTLVDNAMSRIVSGQVVKDANGNEIKIDTTNISGDYDPTKAGSKVDQSSLEGLLRKFMKEYDESGGQDEEKLVQAKAIMQLMISRGGDKGQTAVIRTLEEMSHDENGNGMRTDSTTALGKFAVNYDNGKLMSKLKSTDQAGFALVNDLASENQNIKSLNEYASRVAKNISPEQIPNLSQRAFDTIELAKQRGLYDDTTAVGDAARADLNRFTTAYRNAMNNPRIADSIKGDDLEHLNNANAIMQGKRYEDWAKGEWAKDEWRQDEFLRDQMREAKWRADNGKAANYQLSDVEKGIARHDYANLSAADEATALAGRSTMSEADKATALSSYQDMSGAEIAAAKAKYVGSMTNNDIATAKAKYTNNNYVQRTGDIAKLERGKEVKVPRARASYPDSWRQDNSGQWVDINTGRQLTSDEQEYIEEVRKFNRRIDVENSTLRPHNNQS